MCSDGNSGWRNHDCEWVGHVSGYRSYAHDPARPQALNWIYGRRRYDAAAGVIRGRRYAAAVYPSPALRGGDRLILNHGMMHGRGSAE